ncbi:hypothetical protein N7468_009208 [Penicillium chermesinum]|uniref:Trichothecene 3-O-acetyltransferase-like N-terminal domain-containing protein n=1 Tax=Penicillium chermesinum TaxID=63820 RepID=A0A9W9NHA7_9EURO|nr:uncharacterized protein N7468_009208 [Penicillium chermesinum]KAJ5220004.1 hypothetical protein N7468_009208 [Penicillium chermesinum]KAJ6157461.1 hypothetical protein N7470_005053 [Penicillium chermesinum]
MGVSNTTTATSGLLDIQGQNPSLFKLYTQICSIYAVPDPSSHDTIASTLRSGLFRLMETFPWLAGNVINEGACEGNTGTFRIIRTDEIPLVIKDLRSIPSAPTLDDLRRRNFPMSMLDEKLIAPCLTIHVPGETTGLAVDAAPVFAVQANFITGGLMLTLVGQHNVMDMTGQNQIMNWFSKACHAHRFTPEEISMGSINRADVIPLLEDSVNLEPEIAHQIVKSPLSTQKAPSQPPPSTWGYIVFSATASVALKSWATKTMTLPSGFISTDDSISALIWKYISRARIPRFKPDQESRFARALDVRTSVGAPAAYTGVLTSMAYSAETLDNLDTSPLGVIATDLRKQLDPVKIGRNVRALATFNTRAADKTKTSITANMDGSLDVMLSSWAKVDSFDLDFDLGLGKPEAVRRPAFLPVEGLVYILPRSPAGEIPAAICLRDDDWERLKNDKEFLHYAEYVG